MGTRVTELRLINEDDQALLMTGSSDGSIKIFKDYDSRNQTTILTSFSALPRPDAHSTDFSLTMEWLQTRGEILTAGDSKSIRVWSALTELLSNVRPTLQIRPSRPNPISPGNPHAILSPCHLNHIRPSPGRLHLRRLRRRQRAHLRPARRPHESPRAHLARARPAHPQSPHAARRSPRTRQLLNRRHR